MNNKYQSWNSETREKSKPVKHATLRSAVERVECEIMLHPRDIDDEGWRIQDFSDGEEMTLADALAALRKLENLAGRVTIR